MPSPLSCPCKRHVNVQLRSETLEPICSLLGSKLPKKRQRDGPSLPGFRRQISWQDEVKSRWENTKSQPMAQAFGPPWWATAAPGLRKPMAGTAGCVPQFPNPSLESPAALSQEGQLPTLPAAWVSACCCLHALPALSQHGTFHANGSASTEVAPNPTLYQ